MTGVRLGSFAVEATIASGGMGDVWKGVHVDQRVPVAIKVIRRDGSEDPSFTHAFRREVRAVAQLDHPAIVTIFDVGEVPAEAAAAAGGALEAGSPYLVMEYLERGSLEVLGFPMPWRRAREILLAVLDGLAHAHARGITHRDLKPGNILIGEADGGACARLTDFGIAFSYEERRSADASGQIIGTPPYMAPEQFMAEWRDFGPWTDLYALGCVAYQLAAGHVPFQQRQLIQLGAAHMEHRPPDLECPPDYPPGFAAWVMRLLEKSPRDRYRRCADAAAALASLEPEGAPPERAGWRGRSPPRRSFKLIGTGLGLFSFRTVPLVGRDEERDRLWRLLARVTDEGTPGAVVLEGGAGTGKSRLAEWFCERTHEMGLADRLAAEHDRAEGREFGLSYMMANAWSCLAATGSELEYRVDAVLSPAGMDARPVRRAVAEFLAPAALGDAFRPGMFYEFGSRAERHGILFDVLRRLYKARPIVVWLDDVHWGADSLRFVRYVLQRSATEPIRMVAVLTVRDDLLVRVPDAAGMLDELSARHDVDRMRIDPLADPEIRRLVGSLLYLQGDVAERVAVRSGGNPLYATQLVGDWINRGTLEAGATGFVLAAGRDAAIPDDVHAVWVQRLERVLDECAGGVARSSTPGVDRVATQVALELAVALGGRVDPGEWMAVCSLAGVPDPAPVLEALLASRMARVEAVGWSFAHSMLRDAIERIARERRRWASHNRLCADMLERRRPVPHWGDSERIGSHRFDAAQFGAAVRPLLRGARERCRVEEYSAALRLLGRYDRALDHEDAPDGDHRRLEGWLLRADIHCTRRELADAEELAGRVRSLATGADAPRFHASASLVAARVHQHQGRLHTALAEFGEAERALRSTGPKQTLAKCLSEQAHVMAELGRLDPAWKAFDEAQGIYEEVGQLVPWVANHLGLAQVAFRQGDGRRAVTLCRRACTFARRDRLYRLESAAWSTLAEFEMAERAFDDAERSLDQCIALLEQLGLPLQTVRPRALQALLWLERGTADRAKLVLDALREVPRSELPLGVRMLVQVVALAFAVGGPAATFQAALDDVASVVGDAEHIPPEVARALALAAETATRRGFPDRASSIGALGPSPDGRGNFEL